MNSILGLVFKALESAAASYSTADQGQPFKPRWLEQFKRVELDGSRASRGRRFARIEAVDQWRDEIEAAAAEVYGAATLERAKSLDELTVIALAIIHVESGGNPAAHRLGSQFYGLTQAGRAACIDAGYPDKGKLTARVLHDNPAAALDVLFKVFKRYKDRTALNDPFSYAILWKGGAGTARRMRERTRQLEDAGAQDALYRAARSIEQDPNPKIRIPNLWLYLCEFEEALKVWSKPNA